MELTRTACATLFTRGADLVVLACNTASAIALRRLQQTWLPGLRAELGRPVNILGCIVPTIEAATGLAWEPEPERRGEKVEKLDVIGVFATRATAASRVYEIEIDKRRQDVAAFSEPCPELARLIEQGADEAQLAAIIDAHVRALTQRIGRPPDPRRPGVHALRAGVGPVRGRAGPRHPGDPPAAGGGRRAGALS